MSVYEKLFDYQKRIFDTCCEKQAYGLFLDMGLGKTPLSLALAEYHDCDKILIISVNTKVLESEKVEGSWLYWCSYLDKKYKVSVKKNTSFDVLNNDIYLVNYESLFKRSLGMKKSVSLSDELINFIKSCKGHNVSIIIDESHKMKDIHSMQTKAINRIQKNLKLIANNVYSYLLTGTPFTQGYVDLYSQLCFLGYEQTKASFVDKFCIRGSIPGLLGWQQPIVGYKNIEELYELVHKYAITILSDAVVNLPEQIFIEHKIPSSLSFNLITSEKLCGETIYNYIKSRLISQNKQNELRDNVKVIERIKKYKTKAKVNNPFYRDIGYDITKDYPLSEWLAESSGVFWLRGRQINIGFNGNATSSEWFDENRLNELKKFLEQNKDNYLIFYNYTPELLKLYEICESLGYNVDVYCGECKSLYYYEKYASQTEAEKLTNKNNVIIANFASGSTGKNWQQYNKCIIFSLPLFKDWSQGIKRIHRQGQTKTTFYHVFYQDNWLDRNMYKALKEQVDYSQDMFESDLRAETIMEER